MPLYVGHKNSGFKAVGNLTENNGVYSGFYAGSDLASSGYLQASQKLPEKMSNFQFFIKFTCTALGGSILSSVQDFKGLADISIASDGSYRVWISSNGTSYDIAESFKGNYTFVVGSTYYFSFYWNGAAYQTFIKPEGAAEWTNDIYIAGTKQPYTKDSVLILGIDQSDPGLPFSGSIDANQTTLYIDGKLWLANDAVKAKDLYLGGQKLAYAFLGTKTRAFMCYCSYNATQTICNVNNGASWSGTLARGIYYIRAQGGGGSGGTYGDFGWGRGSGGGSGAGFEGYILVKRNIICNVSTGAAVSSGKWSVNGNSTQIENMFIFGGGEGGKTNEALAVGGELTVIANDDYEILTAKYLGNGNGTKVVDGNKRYGGDSVISNDGGGLPSANATSFGAGGGGFTGSGINGGAGGAGECLIKCVGVY